MVLECLLVGTVADMGVLYLIAAFEGTCNFDDPLGASTFGIEGSGCNQSTIATVLLCFN